MSSPIFFTFIYGVVIFLILYFIIKTFYSVYYTPGSTTVYNSPISQLLFPSDKKLFPSWGYNKLGMLKGDSTKYGQSNFYPQSGPDFVPNKFGSGGPDPSGGMRNPTPASPVSIGWWNGDIKQPIHSIQNIYDTTEIPEKTIVDIGWWGN
jgi:hypothetical protein